MFHLGQWASPGVEKTTRIVGDGSPIRSGGLVPCAPGGEAEVLAQLPSEVDEALRAEGAVLVVGERMAQVPGLPSEVSQFMFFNLILPSLYQVFLIIFCYINFGCPVKVRPRLNR